MGLNSRYGKGLPNLKSLVDLKEWTTTSELK